MDDDDAWLKYIQHRQFFNKLWVNQQAGNHCAPGGVGVDHAGWYISRPVYNISGMGLGAEKIWIEPEQYHSVPPGYFWCEWLDGEHVSADYIWDEQEKSWRQFNTFVACRNPDVPLYRFSSWHRSQCLINPPQFVDVLKNVDVINCEYIGGRLIEVHLRGSPDPVEYDEFVVCWSDNLLDHDHMIGLGYTWLESFDDADGLMKEKRLGFWAK